jgi:hypothetical protein
MNRHPIIVLFIAIRWVILASYYHLIWYMRLLIDFPSFTLHFPQFKWNIIEYDNQYVSIITYIQSILNAQLGSNLYLMVTCSCHGNLYLMVTCSCHGNLYLMVTCSCHGNLYLMVTCSCRVIDHGFEPCLSPNYLLRMQY